MKSFKIACYFFIGIMFMNTNALSHCEIPCGIYDDELRISLIREHVDTIEKSMRMIGELSKEGDTNYNQMVRWIHNKEMHANNIQDIVSQYFLTQRIKPIQESVDQAYETYLRQLSLLHEMLIYAMKSKQTTDRQNIEKLRSLINQFEEIYHQGE